MSTLQKSPQHHDRIRTRPGVPLALGALIAIGLALLILMPEYLIRLRNGQPRRVAVPQMSEAAH
jgi:hypothetical protein